RRWAGAAQTGADRDVCHVRAGGRVRRVSRGGGRTGADRGGGRVDPGGSVVHGGTPPVRVRGPRRGVRVPVLRRGGGDGLVFRAGATAALAGVWVRRAGRAAGKRDPGREQRQGHRYGQACGQAHARGQAGTRTHAWAVHGDGDGRVRERAGAVGAGDVAVAVDELGGDPARRRARADGAHEGGRSVAERRAGQDGDAADAVLCAVC